ncbi:MbcA/ParS/Xre antitoxin family protein [Aliamphritea ceti]|uniref:MbcA/ParS/Xre antitoxin family protein n=1 Tax=Aliamphritea ceti TaxID=1524258 RepID=UPI0021C35741|nr:MbcA/ParS/Xre antitoxin family protein [Aliamphritea ceti]
MIQEKKPELFIDGEVWTVAVNYFGTEEKALRWFRTPSLALGGESPGEYCTKAYSGDREVLDIINRLKHGMTT